MTLEGGIQNIGHSGCKDSWFRFSAIYVEKCWLNGVEVLILSEAHIYLLNNDGSSWGFYGRILLKRGAQRKKVTGNIFPPCLCRHFCTWYSEKSIFCGQKIHPYSTMRNPYESRHRVVHKSKGHHGNGLGWASAGGCGMDVRLTSKGYKRVLDLYRACKYTGFLYLCIRIKSGLQLSTANCLKGVRWFEGIPTEFLSINPLGFQYSILPSNGNVNKLI